MPKEKPPGSTRSIALAVCVPTSIFPVPRGFAAIPGIERGVIPEPRIQGVSSLEDDFPIRLFLRRSALLNVPAPSVSWLAMDYEDFELEIRSTADGYEARVLQSPWGRVSEPFAPPFAPAALEGLLRSLEGLLLGGSPRDLDRPAAAQGARDAPGETAPPPEEMGRVLARHLFPGRVGHYLYGCLGLTEGLRAGGQEIGLRLRICFDRRDRFAPLAALPWELLFLDERIEFLNRDRCTPVVRYLEAGRTEPFRMRDAPRVLLVDSAPVDLDTGRERREIRRALEALEGVEVETYEHPTVEGLRTRLLESPVHVLHFLGHGGFHRATGQGYLCFETADHLTQPVDGQLLGVHLQGLPSLRMVVLNACWSGVFPRHEAQDPFSGVAAELTRKGVPAVVAMQFPVTDGAAITFGRKLYERLARFDPVDAAVTEARLAIWAADPGSVEWATPVLFLGVEDGKVFERVPPDAPPDPRSRGGPEDELRLEIRTFGEWGDADHVLDLETAHASEAEISQAGLVPALEDFFGFFLADIQPVRLCFAAPGSVAFLAGHLLESWSAFDLTVVEETRAGDLVEVSVEPGPSTDDALWRQESSEELDPSARDVAMAVQVSGRLHDGVARCLVAPEAPWQEALSVGRLVTVSALPELAEAGELDGRRLLELAQRLTLAVQERSAERRGTLHLFLAAPIAFWFFLGQLVRDLGSVQLYEPIADTGRWRAALRFPLTIRAKDQAFCASPVCGTQSGYC